MQRGGNMISWLSDFALVMVTFIWGVTFSITKEGVAHIDPFLYLAVRFGLAWVLLRIANFIIDRRLYTWEEMKIGAGAAFFLFTGFITQTAALKYTTASKAAFITGISVVLVPLLAIVLLKERPHRLAVLGAITAFAGMATLSVEPGMARWIGFGDLLALACAFSFAGHILFIGHYATKISPIPFSTIQIGFTAVLSGILGLLKGPLPAINVIPNSVWWGLAYLGILATVGTTLMQTWAQRHTTSTRAAVIFTLESVFAAMFAYLMLGESLTLKTLLGGAFILAGILLAELGPLYGKGYQHEHPPEDSSA